MSTEFDAFAARLAHSFTVLSLRAEDHILEHLISAGDTLSTFPFEVDAQTLRSLVTRFQEDARLWTDVQNAVHAHRLDRHWQTLVEFIYEIANLHGQLCYLEQRFSCPCPEDRRRLASWLNSLDGEIAVRQVLADRRNLAERVNKATGYPMINGLTMRGLTFVLADSPDLWQEFQAFVEPSLATTGRRDSSEAGESRTGSHFGD
jgi:hypothetical protein